MARNYKYTAEEVREKCTQYFEWVENTPFFKYDVVKTGERAGQELKIKVDRMPSLQGLAMFLNVDYQTLYNWFSEETKEKNRDLFDTITHAREQISSTQIDGAGAGVFQPMIVSRLNALKDVQEVTSTTLDATNKTKDEIRAAMEAIRNARKDKN